MTGAACDTEWECALGLYNSSGSGIIFLTPQEKQREQNKNEMGHRSIQKELLAEGTTAIHFKMTVVADDY